MQELVVWLLVATIFTRDRTVATKEEKRGKRVGGPGGVARSYILGQYSVLFDGREDGVTFLRFVRFFTIFFFSGTFVCLRLLLFAERFSQGGKVKWTPFFWVFLKKRNTWPTWTRLLFNLGNFIFWTNVVRNICRLEMSFLS